MRKDKWKAVRDMLVRHCKIVFPVLVVFLGALTVIVALNANKAEAQTPADGQPEVRDNNVSISANSQAVQPTEEGPKADEVPMTANENEQVSTLVASYYNAIGAGDTVALQSICHGISENNLLYFEELATYIDSWSDIEIYVKQGPAEGTTIAYVYYKMGITDYGQYPGYEALYICTGEDGGLYIKDSSVFTEEEKEYIMLANGQVDVVELNNRVAAEYNELIEQNPALPEYVSLVRSQVNTKVGEKLASRVQGEGTPEPDGSGESAGGEGQTPDTLPQEPVAAGPMFASATTTVNVRSSDSEQADKLGKVSRGTRLEVREVLVNGWTKVLYENQDGYIKSDYLQFEENAAGLEVIGTVTANTNLNVRAAADEGGERLGVLAGGSSLELLGTENGWCKVKYNGQVAYVKADYVTQQ